MRAAIAALLSFATAACTAEPILETPPIAHQVLRGDSRETTTAFGVRLTVDSDAWRGRPRALDEVVPVRVSIQNRSGRRLRVSFNDLALQEAGGAPIAALPQRPSPAEGLALGGSGDEASEPGFKSEGYFVAQSRGAVYQGLETWTGPFESGPPPDQEREGDWPARLPTPDMMRQAIPEGVLDRGGRVSGFLYFRNVPRGLANVELRALLVDADTGAELGLVKLPFVIKR